MNKHTPGPWQWFETEAGEARVNPVAGGLLVAKCDTRNPFDDEQRANARLIASAPDLLIGLAQIERLAREADGSLVDARALLGDIARSAIAKSTECSND